MKKPVVEETPSKKRKVVAKNEDIILDPNIDPKDFDKIERANELSRSINEFINRIDDFKYRLNNQDAASFIKEETDKRNNSETYVDEIPEEIPEEKSEVSASINWWLLVPLGVGILLGVNA